MKFISTGLILSLLLTVVVAQTQDQKLKLKQEVSQDDVIRISTSLVQTDVVVTDKNDQIITDLSLQDFEIYDNGKKQEIKFMEFVGVETGRRAEGSRSGVGAEAERATSGGPSAKDVKRTIAFVIDDLTIPIQDLPAVRQMLTDFVDNKMLDGDLVAIVRVVGGKGLLQQFTTDRDLLRRAIKSITPTISPWSASETPDPAKLTNPLAPTTDSPLVENPEATEIYSSNDDVVRLIRGMSALTTAGFVIDSLRDVPGLKNMLIVSAGIPIFENVTENTGSVISNVSSLINRLSDKAVRSSVVVHTLDPRGLRATPGVSSFRMTPPRSALGGNDNSTSAGSFGRGSALEQASFGPLLAGGSEHLGLSTVAKATGGVSVVNTNNFSGGLDKVLARSKGYYELGYAPGGTFDRKFHKIEVKVKREGVKVHHHAGYVAYEDRSRSAPKTKEQEIARAAMAPLASRDIDVTPNVTVKLAPNGDATLDIHMLIAANKLNFTDTGDGKHQVSLDIVGFVFDQMGRQLGGFSETANLSLSAAEYRKAITEGITYSASTQVEPGYYQIRSVVRESSSGSLGTFSKYLEIPDLSKGKLATSSLFMFALESGQSNNPVPMFASRRLTRKQDLRYAVTIYNAKSKDGKAQVRSQVIISKGGSVLFTEPEEILEGPSNKPITKLGQIGLSKVAPGRYVLTVLVTDISDNKVKMSRSLDFTVVN